jgi:hypothetical protein
VIKIKHNSDVLHQKPGKADFGLAYDLKDPREYFATLGAIDYCMPSVASASSPRSSRRGARRPVRDRPVSWTFAVLMG